MTDIKSQITDKVKSWKWRIYKAGLTMEQFCEKTGRLPSQLSDWVTGAKTPNPASVDKMENDLKELDV